MASRRALIAGTTSVFAELSAAGDALEVTAGGLVSSGSSNLALSAGGSYVVVDAAKTLDAASIDRQSAAGISIGGTNANVVAIGRSGISTIVHGVLHGTDDGSGLVVGLVGTTPGDGSTLQHASFTTTERGHLTPANGMVVYNETDNQLQGRVSGAWVDLGASGGGGGGWTDDGAVVRLTTAADNVAIGTASMAGSEKLRVVGHVSIGSGRLLFEYQAADTQIAKGAAPVDTVGGALKMFSGTGGNASAGPAGVGGAIRVEGGLGGDGLLGTAAAAGGSATLVGGWGGVDNGGGSANGGPASVRGGSAQSNGSGGPGSVVGGPGAGNGAGGGAYITGGAANAVGTGAGGGVTIDAGAPGATNAKGTVGIGQTNALSVNLAANAITTFIGDDIEIQNSGKINWTYVGGNKFIFPLTAPNDTTGCTLAMYGGGGGNASAVVGANGGVIIAEGGLGGDGTATLAAGRGGGAVVDGGWGGVNNGGGGGVGGSAILRGGRAQLNAAGGSASVRGGLGAGTGTDGEVYIGTLQTSQVNIAASGISTIVHGVLHGTDDGTGLVVGLVGTGAADGSTLQHASFTTTERGYLTPSDGMVVYNETDNQLQGRVNGAWVNLGYSGGATGGGWTDDGAVVRLTTASDNVGIGTASPGTYKLGVVGAISHSVGDFVWLWGSGTQQVYVEQAPVDTAGDGLSVEAGRGGNASGVQGEQGGALALRGGWGGSGTGALQAGNGGSVIVAAGGGGTNPGGGPASGGHMSAEAGPGSTSGNGTGGIATVRGGASYGTANGGNARIFAGAANGTGVDGEIDIGTWNTSEINLAASGIPTFVHGDMAVGVATMSGSETLRVVGSVLIEVADNDPLALKVVQGSDNYFVVDTTNGSEVITLGNSITNPDVLIDSGAAGGILRFAHKVADSQIQKDQAPVDTQGRALTVIAGTGGDASASGGGLGGIMTVSGGWGGDGSGALAAGAGYAAVLVGGGGGAVGTGSGGAGGDALVRGGSATGNESGGDVDVKGGSGAGTGVDGVVKVGTTNTSVINIAVSGTPTFVHGDMAVGVATMSGSEKLRVLGGALFEMPTNSADTFTVVDDTVVNGQYIGINTTTGAEQLILGNTALAALHTIVLGNKLSMGTGTDPIQVVMSVPDNDSSALRVVEGSQQYIGVDTTNGLEAITLGYQGGTIWTVVTPILSVQDNVNNTAALEMSHGQSAAQSTANNGRLRYNVTLNQFEYSENGSVYAAAFGGGGGSGWTDDGAVVRLTTAADDVAIGVATMSGTEKLRVVGNTRLEGGILFSGNGDVRPEQIASAGDDGYAMTVTSGKGGANTTGDGGGGGEAEYSGARGGEATGDGHDGGEGGSAYFVAGPGGTATGTGNGGTGGSANLRGGNGTVSSGEGATGQGGPAYVQGGSGLIQGRVYIGTLNTHEVEIGNQATSTYMNGPLLFQSTGATAFLAMTDGDSAGLSVANQGRVRYNEAKDEFETSQSGGAYNPLNAPGVRVVASGTTTTTTSITPVLVAGMSVTPEAGTYLVIFSGALRHSTNSAWIWPEIAAGGVQDASSRRQFKRGSPQGDVDTPFSTNAIVTVNGAQAIEGRWSTSTATATCYGRSLTIMRVRTDAF